MAYLLNEEMEGWDIDDARAVVNAHDVPPMCTPVLNLACELKIWWLVELLLANPQIELTPNKFGLWPIHSLLNWPIPDMPLTGEK
jgi:hypothetical protein